MKKSIKSSADFEMVLPVFPAEITLHTSQRFDIIESGGSYTWSYDNYIDDTDNFTTDYDYLYDEDGIIENEKVDLVDDTTLIEDAFRLIIDWLDERISPESAAQFEEGTHIIECDVTLTYMVEDVVFVQEDEYYEYYDFDNVSVEFSPEYSKVHDIKID